MISYMLLTLKVEGSWLREEVFLTVLCGAGSAFCLSICCLPAFMISMLEVKVIQ